MADLNPDQSSISKFGGSLAEHKQIAIVTGASTGIGFELARECARNGFDLLIAADEPAINTAADTLRQNGTGVEAVEADLSTSRAWTSCWPRSTGVRSRRCWPMPGAAWAAASWTRTGTTSAGSSTPT